MTGPVIRCANCGKYIEYSDGEPGGLWLHEKTGLNECLGTAPFGPGGTPLEADEELAEHIEGVHERELAPGTRGILLMHRKMHRQRKDWGHTHAHKTGEVIFDDPDTDTLPD